MWAAYRYTTSEEKNYLSATEYVVKEVHLDTMGNEYPPAYWYFQDTDNWGIRIPEGGSGGDAESDGHDFFYVSDWFDEDMELMEEDGVSFEDTEADEYRTTIYLKVDEKLGTFDKLSDALAAVKADETSNRYIPLWTKVHIVPEDGEQETVKVSDLDSGMVTAGAVARSGDPVTARELVLFTDNTNGLAIGSSVMGQGRSIRENIGRKLKRGRLDVEKLPKLIEYLMDSAAKQYHKDHGSRDTPWHKMFTKADRRLAAKMYVDDVILTMIEDDPSYFTGAV
jgi:hypothetical protein